MLGLADDMVASALLVHFLGTQSIRKVVGE